MRLYILTMNAVLSPCIVYIRTMDLGKDYPAGFAVESEKALNSIVSLKKGDIHLSSQLMCLGKHAKRLVSAFNCHLDT